MARQALQAPVFPAGPESCMSAPGDEESLNHRLRPDASAFRLRELTRNGDHVTEQWVAQAIRDIELRLVFLFQHTHDGTLDGLEQHGEQLRCTLYKSISSNRVLFRQPRQTLAEFLAVKQPESGASKYHEISNTKLPKTLNRELPKTQV